MMRLISRWQNSAGERVRIALNLKGITYRYVPVSSLEPGEYRRLNPQGLLPALDIGGHIVPQSSAILAYIEETYPDPNLLPEDPALRAEARGFAAHIASEMHALTVQRVRQFLRDNWLSNRVFKSYDDIVDHCCYAWNTLIDRPWKIMSIGLRLWAHGF
jgi:maleylacetoacetate isomerase